MAFGCGHLPDHFSLVPKPLVGPFQGQQSHHATKVAYFAICRPIVIGLARIASNTRTTRNCIARVAHIGPRSSCAAHASIRKPKPHHLRTKVLGSGCCSGQGPHTELFHGRGFQLPFLAEMLFSAKKRSKRKLGHGVGNAIALPLTRFSS